MTNIINNYEHHVGGKTMGDLTIIDYCGQKTIDSRQVAEMVDKRHDNLVRDIDGYVAILNQNSNMRADDFFIESNYQAGTGKSYKCYLLTRIGCDMVANKMTGEKGVLFTAAYVTKFNEMEKQSIKSLRTKQITPRIKPAFKDAIETSKLLESIGVKSGIALAAAIKAVEKNSGVDLTEITKCLPPAEHETGYLNATELGKRIGVGSVKVNQLLAEKGLIYQTISTKGKKEWHLTDTGKRYGEEFPYDAKTGHSGYQIKWNLSVLDALGKSAS